MKVFVAHWDRQPHDLFKVRNIISKKIPDAEVSFGDFEKEYPQTSKEALKADAVVLVGVGRLIGNGGRRILKACRIAKIPVYFIMTLQEADYSSECYKWATKHSKTSAPQLQLLFDEVFSTINGDEVVLLPAHSI